MYRIIIENRAVKEIESLPNGVIQNIVDAIERLRVTPRAWSKEIDWARRLADKNQDISRIIYDR